MHLGEGGVKWGIGGKWEIAKKTLFRAPNHPDRLFTSCEKTISLNNIFICIGDSLKGVNIF